MNKTYELLVEVLSNRHTREELSWLTVAQIQAKYSLTAEQAKEVQQLSRDENFIR
jgi:hypothetical protein